MALMTRMLRKCLYRLFFEKKKKKELKADLEPYNTN